MNLLLFILVFCAFGVAAWNETHGISAMAPLGEAILQSAQGSVTLALGLIGVMALFLGLMKVAEAGGMIRAVARLLTPLLVRLFPDVPAQHPAMGAMVMNVAANVLGLGNAATPFGIRAMEHLDRLNPHPGTATDAQVLFLVINTASVTILPTSVIALRTASGSAHPAAVIAPTLAATLISAIIAVLSAKWLQRYFPAARRSGDRHPASGTDLAPGPNDPDKDDPDKDDPCPTEPAPPPAPVWATAITCVLLVALIPVMAIGGQTLGPWLIPVMVVGLLGFGVVRGVRIYEVFVEGAREGFEIGVRIIPYLVAIMVAVAMVRSSGAMELVLTPLQHLLQPVGVPAEALVMAGMRSLSGSGSFGLLASYLQDSAIGVDSPTGVLLGTIYGSSETTFYVLAVYFGAVGIRKIRHALICGLIADLAGLLAAIIACRLMVA